eukprot:TRINITY_DN9421_c0_g1_i1.p1 TRINITY_DN9421_c0_g1~~TRINITY_DN9421_c0_g1_i1.p1  ORF type:complete len:312 (-),score=60.08 TRINITY_DN9421_c0_g1_i1:248-1183(-)
MADRDDNSWEMSFQARSGITLAAKVWGVENNPVVKVLALHGWLDNAGTYDLLAPLILQECQVPMQLVCLDFAGHGRSGHRPDGVYSTHTYVQDCADVLEQLGWKKYSIIGHSMGGAVSLILCAILTESVERLILLDSIGPPSRDGPESVKYLRSHVERYLSRKTIIRREYKSRKAGARRRKKIDPNVALSSLEILMKRGMRHVGEGYQISSDHRIANPTPSRLSEEQVRAFISAVECPVLYLRGSPEKSVFTNIPHVELYKARPKFFKDLSVVKMDGSHHFHLDHSKETADALCPFLLKEYHQPSLGNAKL